MKLWWNAFWHIAITGALFGAVFGAIYGFILALIWQNGIPVSFSGVCFGGAYGFGIGFEIGLAIGAIDGFMIGGISQLNVVKVYLYDIEDYRLWMNGISATIGGIGTFILLAMFFLLPIAVIPAIIACYVARYATNDFVDGYFELDEADKKKKRPNPYQYELSGDVQ